MIIKIIAGVVTVLIVGVLIYASTKPDTFRVKRTARIKAPPEKIYALIEDFHQWISWSPYENRDPAMKKTYSGAPLGKGAVYAWEGNSKEWTTYLRRPRRAHGNWSRRWPQRPGPRSWHAAGRLRRRWRQQLRRAPRTRRNRGPKTALRRQCIAC